jgi:hypothetical protein
VERLGAVAIDYRREVSKDAELLVRQENAVLRRQIGQVRYQPADLALEQGRPVPAQ